MGMNGMKFYYQILIIYKQSKKKLIFWIRDTNISYDNNIELASFIKSNLSVIKKYKSINNIVAMEISEKDYNSFIAMYDDNKRDFIIIDDTK